MKNIINYYGTINGTNFFLRYLLSILGIFSTAFGMGIYITKENYPLVVVFALLMSAFIYFNFITYVKRFRALFPDYVIPFVMALVFFNMITLIGENELTQGLVNLSIFVLNMVLIFKNSNIKEHDG
jgi:hypothetical protein